MATDIQQLIQSQVSSSPVVIYIKGTPKFPQCGFSAKVVQILSLLGVKEVLAVNVFEDPALVPGRVCQLANLAAVLRQRRIYRRL
jgi:monothiol glutaredoxin